MSDKKDWTINMKIKFLIDKSYKEPEIHICSAEDTPEIRGVIKAIKKTIDISFNALDNDNTVVVNASDIIRFYSANKMVYVTTAEGDYRIKERLYELEEKLDDNIFIRISNSEIINIKKLIKMDTSITGTIKMYLSNDVESYVSRRFVSKIKKALHL